MILGIPELKIGIQSYDAVSILEDYLEEWYGDVEKEYERSPENERIYNCLFYVPSGETYVLEFHVLGPMNWVLVDGYSY